MSKAIDFLKEHESKVPSKFEENVGKRRIEKFNTFVNNYKKLWNTQVKINEDRETLLENSTKIILDFINQYHKDIKKDYICIDYNYSILDFDMDFDGSIIIVYGIEFSSERTYQEKIPIEYLSDREQYLNKVKVNEKEELQKLKEKLKDLDIWKKQLEEKIKSLENLI